MYIPNIEYYIKSLNNTVMNIHINHKYFDDQLYNFRF